ncbi:protein sprouty homolog 4 [Megalops cyprinoides]|uniref:protein sprouty homolog 4 n=1 Tax=Megalops cyprinoides TaxID=118141 RepID=UPI00186559D6|nr:protein sprouty homolog 4 [Megalops cyprinoides]
MKDADIQMESRVPHHIPGVSSSVMVQPLLDSRVPYGRLQHPLTIFPIDQMKSSHVENDYIDSPAVVSQQPASQKAARGPHEGLLGGSPHPHSHPHLPRCDPHDVTHPWISFSGRPSSISSSSSTSSDQRLLDHAAPTPVADQVSGGGVSAAARTPGLLQPKLLGSKPLDLKAPIPAAAAGVPRAEKTHTLLCEDCGKCKCTECTLPRTLPSCWVCNQEYLCSAQSLVDSATCMCLVRGIFYHCTNDEDEEGSCADRPCSCSHSNCCARWSFMAALSLVLPCLVCYLPATGCAKLSQKCYDSASRPGCRCKNSQACKALEGKVAGLEKQSS